MWFRGPYFSRPVQTIPALAPCARPLPGQGSLPTIFLLLRGHQFSALVSLATLWTVHPVLHSRIYDVDSPLSMDPPPHSTYPTSTASRVLRLLLQPRHICLKLRSPPLLRRLLTGQAVPPNRLCRHPRLRLSTPSVACKSGEPMVRRRRQLLVPSRRMCRASSRLILSCSPTDHLRLPGGHRRCRSLALLEELNRDFHPCFPQAITVRA